jgi:hypothetical protein
MENFLSCDRSKVFDAGFGIATFENIDIVLFVYEFLSFSG